MELIALFFPAFISMAVRHRRNKELSWNVIACLVEYAVLVVINVFLGEAVITYGLRMTGVDNTGFSSFGFFTKYLFIASVIAYIVPYVEEVVKKYVSISFSVGDSSEKQDK